MVAIPIDTNKKDTNMLEKYANNMKASGISGATNRGRMLGLVLLFIKEPPYNLFLILKYRDADNRNISPTRTIHTKVCVSEPTFKSLRYPMTDRLRIINSPIEMFMFIIYTSF